MNTLDADLVIHYHHELSKKIIQQPGYFKKLAFESIPFFKLYSLEHVSSVRETIEGFSFIPMPHKLQKTFRKLKPPLGTENNYYRYDLIPLAYCTYNRLGFFVRAYKLRVKDFFKVEITFHSDTLGKGKYFDFEKAYANAKRIFQAIENEGFNSLNPSGLHRNDYFPLPFMRELVSEFDYELKQLHECINRQKKRRLKKDLKEALLGFQENSLELARNHLLNIQKNTPTE